MSRIASILLWSVIAAAFIGPGTVTTATKAGAEGGMAYAWVIVLASVAGYILMEMTARVTSASGQSLGTLVQDRSGGWLPILLFLAVGMGCVAYEAGNLLGGLKGLQLLGGVDRSFVLVLGMLATALLYMGNIRQISNGLAIIVAVMGVCFLVSGILGWTGEAGVATAPNADGFRPAGVQNSTIIALLGTTIVPYNFFIAAGLGRGKKLSDIRLGLGVSFGLGACITLGILLTGGLLSEVFSDFQALSTVLEIKLGIIGPWMLGIGLFAAGLSSAITAPLALALAGRALLGREDTEGRWSTNGRYFRLAWATCLLFGLTVAGLDLDLIGVIFTAQLVNGLMLPFVAGLVLWLANDTERLGDQSNRLWQNILGGLILIYLIWVNGGLVIDKLLA
ncbi:MAG: divalent metal cation transporter [Bacteroidota bacterium]